MQTRLEDIQKYGIVLERAIQAHKAQLEALKRAKIAKRYYERSHMIHRNLKDLTVWRV